MQQQDKRRNKELYKQSAQTAKELFDGCQGYLLVFILLCFCVKKFVLFPLLDAAWSWALHLLPHQFVTDGTILTFVQHFYVPLIGLVLLALMALVSVWEICAIMLCIEARRQQVACTFVQLMRLSVQNTLRAAHPKNILFFVYLLLVVPFVNLFSGSGMQVALEVPEYISDYILASTPLTVLYVLLSLALLVLVVRWFYCMQGVLLGQKSFREACKDSAHLMHGRSIRQVVELLVYALRRTVRLCAVPAIVAAVVMTLTAIIMDQFVETMPAMTALIFPVFTEVFITLLVIYVRMALMCYQVSNYWVFAEAAGMPAKAPLEQMHEPRRVWSFKKLRPALFTTVIALGAVCLVAGSIATAYHPEVFSFFTNNTQIVAHKGYAAKAPENTMEAFEAAYECSDVDAIELDVRESKDGVPIVIHNASLKNACGVDVDVYDLTYEEIRSYNAHYGFTEEEFPDAYVPTLEEVVAKYGGKMKLLIEIKANARTPNLPEKIIDLLNKYNCKDMCEIHSGSYEALEAVKSIDASIPCGYIVALGAGEYSSLTCADFFSVEHNFVNRTMLDKVHALGKKVYAWTVNDAVSIDTMAGLDVDAVITDDPAAVHEEGYSANDVVKEYIQQLQAQATSSSSESASADDA